MQGTTYQNFIKTFQYLPYLTLSVRRRNCHVIVGPEIVSSCIPRRDIHVNPGGSKSDHFAGRISDEIRP